MFNILLIIAVIVAILCLCVVVGCLFVAAKENGLPDIDDVELVELFASKIQKVLQFGSSPIQLEKKDQWDNTCAVGDDPLILL